MDHTAPYHSSIQFTKFMLQCYRLGSLLTVGCAEWATMTNHNMQLLFLDWKQAFDSIDHTAMLEALKRFGLSNKMLSNVSSIYHRPMFFVHGFNQSSCQGVVSAGIRRGCSLSPYLFIIVLSVMLADLDTELARAGTPTNTWSDSHSVYDLEYADDTLVMSITAPQLQGFLNSRSQQLRNMV